MLKTFVMELSLSFGALCPVAGQAMSRIGRYEDCYHRYRLRNPSTRIEYRTKLYDLRNIGGKKGYGAFLRFEDTFREDT